MRFPIIPDFRIGAPSSHNHNRNHNRPYSESWDTNYMETDSDDEKLDVYKASIEFVSWADERLERLPKPLAVSNQPDRASTSIPLM